MDFQQERSCRDCHTRRTPLWRAGPDGPRSLCNACGLRYIKRRRRNLLGLDNGSRVNKTRKKNTRNISSELGGSMNQNVELQFKLKEEEEAAVLLMALSSASLKNFKQETN
ncbi:hypothetical protein L6164_010271 [Bauhinia variegata]|uniref:Uncharacterized protein n=1 Tax=Bauhinia variegata TaxID=167791 RepID=A0ACB9PQ45_BAUVA|nr:hypothetical protein L6164_010271 [Bauhinia variegata]